MKPWTCQRSGECCTKPAAVVMTSAEWAELADKPAQRPVVTDTSKLGWVALKAAPCPFYDVAAKSCTVYDVRPFACRRFQCGRWNVRAEPFTSNPMPLIRADNDLRWTFQRNQREHQAWALAHGWQP